LPAATLSQPGGFLASLDEAGPSSRTEAARPP